MVTLELISSFNLTEASFPDVTAVAVHENELLLAGDHIDSSGGNFCGISRYLMDGGMPETAKLMEIIDLGALIAEQVPSSTASNVRNIQVLRLKISADKEELIVSILAEADTASITSGFWRADLQIYLTVFGSIRIDGIAGDVTSDENYSDFDTGFAEPGFYYSIQRSFEEDVLDIVDLSVIEQFSSYRTVLRSGRFVFTGERYYEYRNGDLYFPSEEGLETDAKQYLFYKNFQYFPDNFRFITLLRDNAIINTQLFGSGSVFPREIDRYELPFGGIFLSAALSQAEDAIYSLIRTEDGNQSIILLSNPENYPFAELGFRRYAPLSAFKPPKRLYHQYRNSERLRIWLDIVAFMAKAFHFSAERVRRSYDVENSAGEQLNVIGRIVVLPRSITTTTEVDYTEFGNSNDEFGADRSEFGAAFGESVVSFGEELYRTLLKAKIHKNNGDATTDSIIKACGIIVPNNQCTIIDNGDRSITIAFQNPLTEMQRLIFSNFSILPVAHGIRIASIIDG